MTARGMETGKGSSRGIGWQPFRAKSKNVFAPSTGCSSGQRNVAVRLRYRRIMRLGVLTYAEEFLCGKKGCRENT